MNIEKQYSDECRRKAELGIAKAGHASPIGSVHSCATCGGKHTWNELVWRKKEINSIPTCPRV